MKSKWNSILISWKTSDGTLLEVVKLRHRKNSMLRSMCTDDEGDLLFTVDSSGYVVVWGLGDATGESPLVKKQFYSRAHQKAIVNVEYIS